MHGNEIFTRTGTDLAFNFMRAEIASSADEILFVMFVEQDGLRQAMHLAAQYDLKCSRPLRVLLSGTRVPDRSYTKRHAKPRRFEVFQLLR